MMRVKLNQKYLAKKKKIKSYLLFPVSCQVSVM